MKLRITVEGKTYDVDVEVLDGQGASPPAPARPAPAKPSAVPAVEPAAGRSHAPAPLVAHDSKRCVSPLPGTVLKVKVKAGDTVTSNQTMVVLDAMKMETNVPSPLDGKVKAVHVNSGDSVRQGDLLVEFD